MFERYFIMFGYLMRLCFLNLIILQNIIQCQNLTDSKPETNIETENVLRYGKGYGTEWIYFPDGDGKPHLVNLKTPQQNQRFYNLFAISDLQYRLYTRNMDGYIILDGTAKPINANVTNCNTKALPKPIKIITHGWKSSADSRLITNIKDAYLNKQDLSVITIDWSETADSILYPIVVEKIKTVGSYISNFLNSLHKTYNVNGNDLHLIGHSLGAHVMGSAAFQTNLTIYRITGLDPARPMFEYPKRPASERLDSLDARFVDVIHTCSGVLGVAGAIGNADFFPNNGHAPQPGCETLEDYHAQSCSHSISQEYFAESIKNKMAYKAYRCTTWNKFLNNQCDKHVGIMGDGLNAEDSGIFFLKT